MPKLAPLAGILAALAVAHPSLAQQPRTETAPATDAQRPSAAMFLQRAAMGDRFEIGSSRLAQERSANDAVKQFARGMVQDHTQTTQQRMDLMQRLRLPGGAQVSGRESDSRAGADMTTGAGGVQPEGLDARHRQMLGRLQAAQGAEFDRLYAQMQVQAHREAVQLYEAYAQSGDNAELRQFAQQAVPKLREHLAMAQRLQGELGG